MIGLMSRLQKILNLVRGFLGGIVALTLSARVSLAHPIQAVLFDVFGTTVQVSDSLTQQGKRWGQSHQLKLDWNPFTESWIEHHSETVEAIRMGQMPWRDVDQIHALGLRKLLPQYLPKGVVISETMVNELCQFWHRLEPWPDVVQGLNQLDSKFKIGALSNANTELLRELTQWSHLPWNLFFSGAEIQHYKPDPEVYAYAEDQLHLPPETILLVASHTYDLMAAQSRGWKTALVSRTESIENKPDLLVSKKPLQFDYRVSNFVELANLLEGN
jgi:2-haloacid dehalogenase